MKKFLLATAALLSASAMGALLMGPISSAVAGASGASINLLPAYVADSNTSASTTITTGHTWQTALSANSLRKNCTIYNNNASDALYVWEGAGTAPTYTLATKITAGNSWSCATAGIGVAVDAIQITGATSADTVLIVENQ